MIIQRRGASGRQAGAPGFDAGIAPLGNLAATDEQVIGEPTALAAVCAGRTTTTDVL
jgi:hypothetical protein